jgi:hypothetical protein
MLIYWAYFFALPPFSRRGSVFHQPPFAVSILWWFTDCFSVLWGSLTLGAAHWVKRWSLWSATCPISKSGLSPTQSQPSCLSSICILIGHAEINPFPLPSSLGTFCFPTPSAFVLDYSLLFIVHFWGEGDQSAQKLCCSIPGMAGEIPCNAWYSHLFGL